MSRPAAKGWCPGAYRPMMSGDGLVVRVRPMLGRVTRAQVTGLCDLAATYGSGILEFTSRANIQIRGVREAHHEPLLQALNALGLLPDDPALEARRNVLMPLDWKDADDSHVIGRTLIDRLHALPELPAKFGFAVDAGPAPSLFAASADIRIERGQDGLIIRADGVSKGRPVTRDTAVDAAIEMAVWFSKYQTPNTRRMKAVVSTTALPSDWALVAPRNAGKPPQPGTHPMGQILGVAFGQTTAQDLAHLIETSQASALRTSPWRLFLLEDAVPVDTDAFVTNANDPRLNVTACPGAPLCGSTSVATRSLAASLAPLTDKSLHISGCNKGCAKSTPASLTLIGRNGTFDLVKDGCAWDTPTTTGLVPDDLKTRIGEF